MNSQDNQPEKIRRTVFLRWELLAIVVVMLLILGVAALSSLDSISNQAQIVVYGALFLLGGFILYVSIFQWRRLETRLTDTQADLDRTRSRLRRVFQMGRNFALVETEEEAIDIGLEACLDVAGALGISYLPFDERGHARPLVSLGDLGPDELKDVAPHLSLPSVRSMCAFCSSDETALHTNCSLPFPDIAGVGQVFCMSARRYGRDLGLVNLYFGETIHMDPEAEAIVAATIDEMAIVIEAVRLRNQDPFGEVITLNPDDFNLKHVLPGLASSYFELAKADFLVYSSDISPQEKPRVDVLLGTIPEGYEGQAMEMLHSACLGATPSPMQMPFIPDVHSPKISACSLFSTQGAVLGGLVMGWGGFSSGEPWQRRNVQTAADGLAKLAEYSGVVEELEYRTILAERNRLAREIHDGLAQNIGYIKLLTARMTSFMKAGDWDRLEDSLEDCRSALEVAYEDARGAIDNLIITPDQGFRDWIDQVGVDFENRTGIKVTVSGEDLPVEPALDAQAQMIRILQESLTNVRKHAAATQVWIEWFQKQGGFTLEIRDDGLGFQSELALDTSQFGLLSMREHAELIDAEIQVVSSAQEGTIVRLRLPVYTFQSKT